MTNKHYCLTHGVATDFDVTFIGTPCIIVSCPPPDEFDLDGWEFILNLPVPDDEELARMNESAEELWFDCWIDQL